MVGAGQHPASLAAAGPRLLSYGAPIEKLRLNERPLLVPFYVGATMGHLRASSRTYALPAPHTRSDLA